MFQANRGHSVLAFAIALTLAYALTPLVRALCIRFGAIDRPQDRKVHSEPVPTLGGIAIFVAFAVGAIAATWGVPGRLPLTPILCGCLMIVIVGILDDLFDLRPILKLLGQMATAGFLWWNGIRISGFGDPAHWVDLEAWQSAAITILWIVGITNTINFIDGLDGLAAGVSAVSAAALGLIAMQVPHGAPVATLAAATCGASLGFLRHNFNPAKIFMGDTGAQLLGLILAVISILGPFKTATAVSILVATLALGVPVFDTAFAIFRRMVNRKPVYVADRGHLHHRLVDRGFSQKQAVMVLYAVSCLLCAAAIAIYKLV